MQFHVSLSLSVMCRSRVIIDLLHVIHIVLHFQFDAVALVILPAFKLLVPVFLGESL